MVFSFVLEKTFYTFYSFLPIILMVRHNISSYCDSKKGEFTVKCNSGIQPRNGGILMNKYFFPGPNCQENNAVNFANMKDMSTKEYEELKELIKQIQVCK